MWGESPDFNVFLPNVLHNLTPRLLPGRGHVVACRKSFIRSQTVLLYSRTYADSFLRPIQPSCFKFPRTKWCFLILAQLKIFCRSGISWKESEHVSIIGIIRDAAIFWSPKKSACHNYSGVFKIKESPTFLGAKSAASTSTFEIWKSATYASPGPARLRRMMLWQFKIIKWTLERWFLAL